MNSVPEMLLLRQTKGIPLNGIQVRFLLVSTTWNNKDVEDINYWSCTHRRWNTVEIFLNFHGRTNVSLKSFRLLNCNNFKFVGMKTWPYARNHFTVRRHTNEIDDLVNYQFTKNSKENIAAAKLLSDSGQAEVKGQNHAHTKAQKQGTR